MPEQNPTSSNYIQAPYIPIEFPMGTDPNQRQEILDRMEENGIWKRENPEGAPDA